MLDSLPWRERRVIELRYGLGDEGPMTLEDIGQEVGVTRERVRQIESKTLATLKSSAGRRASRARLTRPDPGPPLRPVYELAFVSWKQGFSRRISGVGSRWKPSVN